MELMHALLEDKPTAEWLAQFELKHWGNVIRQLAVYGLHSVAAFEKAGMPPPIDFSNPTRNRTMKDVSVEAKLKRSTRKNPKRPPKGPKRAAYTGWLGEFDISGFCHGRRSSAHRAPSVASSVISSYNPTEDLKAFYQQEYKGLLSEEVPRRLHSVELSLNLKGKLS